MVRAKNEGIPGAFKNRMLIWISCSNMGACNLEKGAYPFTPTLLDEITEVVCKCPIWHPVYVRFRRLFICTTGGQEGVPFMGSITKGRYHPPACLGPLYVSTPPKCAVGINTTDRCAKLVAKDGARVTRVE